MALLMPHYVNKLGVNKLGVNRKKCDDASVSTATSERQIQSPSVYGTTRRSINDRGQASWAAYDFFPMPSAG